jgi:hypothetical protein
MIVENVRFSYMQVFEPKDSFGDGKLAYSCTFLIPKKDKNLVKEVKEAIEKAVNTGVAAGKFKQGAPKMPSFKRPLRDGDAEREANPDSRGPEYEGMYFFNARNTNPIGCVDAKLRPIMPEEQDQYYSGWWGHADVNFYAFNYNGTAGIAAGLNNLMFMRADERLDGRQNAVDAFAGLEVDDSEETDFE